MRRREHSPRSKRNVGRSIAALVALAGMAAGASATGDRVTARPPVNDTGALTLSMKVDPGQPVPIELITDEPNSELRDKGYRGQGIDVALIDSGVTQVDGLDDGQILYGPDLSNEGGQANLANLDTFGHGTHLAGIIVGDDPAEDDDDAGVVGIATDSRLVSVKVAGATGETDVAQVIAGIDWVVEHKNDNGLNIRVLNLSLGIAGVTSSSGDPLSMAVERAWDAGIVVVAAAGNRGNGSGGIDSPAVSPYVIAVGAIASYDSDRSDDKMATWSSGGNANRTPDIVAPGRSIMSFRVPGSMLDITHPEAVVEDDYFLGSGTSQSAAVVSGFVAAMLSRNPAMTPDQVKGLLTYTADDVVPGTTLDGFGKIDARTAAIYTQKAAAFPAQNYETKNSVSAVLSGASWSGGEWTGASWSGGTWSGASWSGASWSGASWSGASWSGASWSGASWSGASWSGASWSGASWSGASWSSNKWSSVTWSGSSWA